MRLAPTRSRNSATVKGPPSAIRRVTTLRISAIVSADAPPFTFRESGEPLAVEGRAFLRVNFLEMYGHACSDHPTPSGAYPQRSPAELRPGLEVVAQVCPSDDFEGYLEWIIGLTRGARWRVSRLEEPARLLVDVENKIRLASLGTD